MSNVIRVVAISVESLHRLQDLGYLVIITGDLPPLKEVA